ncbi:MAG: hypothetical protein WAX89_00750 [Alphaproteobacteria bacterium]
MTLKVFSIQGRRIVLRREGDVVTIINGRIASHPPMPLMLWGTGAYTPTARLNNQLQLAEVYLQMSLIPSPVDMVRDLCPLLFPNSDSAEWEAFAQAVLAA